MHVNTLIVLIKEREGACVPDLYVQYVCVCAEYRTSICAELYLLHIHVIPHMWPSTVNKEY